MALPEHLFSMITQHKRLGRKTTPPTRKLKDIFEKELHAYTITNAIDDQNVLRFHVEYFKGKGNINPKQEKRLLNKQ